MDWTPEFLITKRSAEHRLREILAEAVDLACEIIAEFIFHVPGTLGKLLKRLAGHLTLRFWLWGLQNPIPSWLHNRLLAKSQRYLKRPHSLEELREAAGKLFVRSGYTWSDEALAQWENGRGHLPAGSKEDFVSPRELLVQTMGGFFEGVLRWKGKDEKIEDPKDRQILDFLIDQLDDQDPKVVTAAVRGIGAVAEHLTPRQHQKVLTKYHNLLNQSPDEVARGSVARDLGRNVADLRSLEVAMKALNQPQSPWVAAYLAEMIEFLVHRFPFEPQRDQREMDELSRLLIKKARDLRSGIALRVNCIKALARVSVANEKVFKGLRAALLWDSDPTVQETAVWALARLFGSSESPQFASLTQLLTRLIGRFHPGRPNPYLERYAHNLLQWLSRASRDPELIRQAAETRLLPHVEAHNPLVLIKGSSLPRTIPP